MINAAASDLDAARFEIGDFCGRDEAMIRRLGLAATSPTVIAPAVPESGRAAAAR